MRINVIATVPPGSRNSMARYADLLMRALATHRPELDLVRTDLALPALMLARFPHILRNRVHHAAVALAARRLCAGDSGDTVFHLTDGSHAYVANRLPPERTVVTAHDVIPLLALHGRMGERAPGVFARKLITLSARALSRAVAIVADSHSTVSDLAALTETPSDRVTVVYPPLVPASELPPHGRRAHLHGNCIGDRGPGLTGCRVSYVACQRC